MIAVALGLSGCFGGANPATTVAPRPLGGTVPAYRPSVGDTARPLGPTFQNPPDTVSLHHVVALTLLHSPDLAAFGWEARAREARVLQAGRLPNPVVAVLAEDLGASTPLGGVTDAGQLVQPQTTIQLSQLIELGGKRAARRNLAARDHHLAGWDYEAARIDVLTLVTRGFIDVLAAQEMVALAGQTTELVEQVQRSVAARVLAGVVSPIEETKADVALAAARVESDRAVRQLAASRARLAGSWGATEATFSWAAGELTVIAEPPSIAALTTRIADNPDLARWADEISQRQAVLAVERSKRVPDVTLTAGYRRFTDLRSDAYVIGGSLALPLFDRNHGATEEAKRRLAKAYEERRASTARVAVALAEASRALSSAHQEVVALRTTMLPGSQQAFDAVSEGYRLGKFGYLDVLDAQRTLTGARAQYLRALTDYHKAVAAVERLIGAPLNSTANPPAPPARSK